MTASAGSLCVVAFISGLLRFFLFFVSVVPIFLFLSPPWVVLVGWVCELDLLSSVDAFRFRLLEADDDDDALSNVSQLREEEEEEDV